MTDYGSVVCMWVYLRIKLLSSPLQLLRKTDGGVSGNGGEADEVAD